MHDPVLAVGEFGGDGLVGFAAHDYGFAESRSFEVSEVSGEVPGEGAARSDHAVAGHGGDQRDHRALLDGDRRLDQRVALIASEMNVFVPEVED